MLKALKQEWSQLKRGRPGQRFVAQFNRNEKESSTGFGRVLRIVVGLLLIPIGVFFLAVPGPGLVVIAMGAVMLARESRTVASAMDAMEVRTRQAVGAIRGRRRATKP